jgi:asparagine synthase (glutamine-hydrolysing)
MGERDAVDRFRTLFSGAVEIRLRSDVPVGTCLSGGLDSSAIFLQMARLQSDAAPLHAFSAFFEDPRLDERRYVAEVLSRTKGIGHHVFPTPDRFLADQDAFLYQQDEPPASLSMFASSCVMRLARETGVPVLLNGQGGDELFGGYWPAYLLWLRTMLASRPGAFVEQVVRMMLPDGNREIFRQLLPHWRQYRSRQARLHRSLLRPAFRDAGFTLNHNWAHEAQSLSPTAYRLSEIRRIHLPRLLKWEDRNSMAFSIEVRYPFLDHRLVDWAVSVPPELNFQRGWNKWIIRQALTDLLPPAIRMRRNKVGFETPQASWIRHELRPVLSAWVANPSERLRAIVEVPALQSLLQRTFERSREVPHLDESQLLLVRLFFLDRWLNIFNLRPGVSL